MTRVLQVMAGAEHGGAEAFFTRLVLALNRAGLEQEVLIRQDPGRAAVLRDGGVDFTELPFGGRFDLRTRYGFHRAVAKFKPQVVLTWMNRATLFCPATAESNADGRFVHVARLGGYYDMKNYQACDHLIGNTRNIVSHLTELGWPEDHVHYLPNFVDDTSAEPLSRTRNTTPGEAPLILALGRLHENKGFDVVIRAISELPHAYLWVAGEGPLRNELEALCVRVGVRPRVRFFGWRDDTAALFAAADMLVCPSRHEPLGNVVIEGWAHRVPVIATDCDGPKELIRDDRNGLLVPVDDAKALAKTIKRLILNPGLSRVLVNGGRKSFEVFYAEKVVVARYLEFFEKVAG